MKKEAMLKYLLRFYNTYKDNLSSAAKSCPFAAIWGSAPTRYCENLCFSIEMIKTSDYTICPCTEWGPKEAMDRLKRLLIKEKLLNKNFKED
jgi:hypothetical protein